VSVRRHCNRAHKWTSTKQERKHWTSVKAQTFFTSGGLQRYFAVQEDVVAELGDAEAEFKEWQEFLREYEDKESKMNPVGKTDRTGWFKLTGWPDHLVGSNLKELSRAIRLPDPKDEQLKKACQVVDAMIEQGVSGLQTLALDTRAWLRSAKRAEPDPRGIGRLEDPKGQGRYALYWKQFVCYCLRVANCDDDGLADARRLFVWQGDQKELAVGLWQSLDNDPLQKMIDLSMSFISASTGNDPFQSGLVHFMAVLGINGDTARLYEPQDYSYKIAAVVYCMRVITAEGLLPSANRDEEGDAERDNFLQKRLDFLCTGSYSPMSTTLHMLAYSKKVARENGSMGNTVWSTDGGILFLHGQPIVLTEFRGMVQQLSAEAERLLWRELMQMDQFAISLDDVVDAPAEKARRASFVNGRNNLHRGLATMFERDIKGYRAARKYLRRVEAFLELLLLLVHITGGQPARGTEITAVRFRNAQAQDRNIYVIAGQVMVLTRYHKSQSQSGKPKIIPRFLPARVGQLLSIYLVYVEPFREKLEMRTLKYRHRTDYLWPAEPDAEDSRAPWDTERLTRVMERETLKHLGTKLNTRGYRHVAISIGRRVVGDEFGRGYHDEVEDVEEEDENPLELQAGRTTRTGTRVYGVLTTLVEHLSERSLQMFRQLSNKWHEFFGLDMRGREPEPVLELKINVQAAMQQVLGTAIVGFRSPDQERALQDILSGASPVVVILPTGGGKSLLFMVPACMEAEEGGVSVVVVPFRALVDDLLQRLDKARVLSIEWHLGVTSTAAVVVVSADVASGPTFMTYARALKEAGRLRRVVIDEVHLTLTDSTWRPKLAQLCTLRSLGCQFVLLTATLPPLLENRLGRAMAVQSPKYVRATTARGNIRYKVVECLNGHLEETAVAMCRRRKEQQGVVYCRSKAQCEAISEQLGCRYYHADVLERAEELRGWIRGGSFIVATSALGTGIDIPGITFVLHVDAPWGMIDYAQSSGRAAREGGHAESVILVEKRRLGGQVRAEEISSEVVTVSEVDAQAMMEFIRTPGCRRAVMGRYLDGVEAQCSSDQAACDRCGDPEWQHTQQQEGREWALVEATLTELAAGCAVCWVFGRNFDHARASCRHKQFGEVALHTFRQQIRYSGGMYACMKCGIEQHICGRGDDSNAPCRWPNVLVGVARAVWGFGVVRRLGFTGGLQEYGVWLGKVHGQQLWGRLVSNGMAVVVRTILDRRTAEQTDGAGSDTSDLTQLDDLDGPDERSELQIALDTWSIGCCWCRAGNLDDLYHDIKKCPDAVAFRPWLDKKLSGIAWENYASCWTCNAPQALCAAWQPQTAGRWIRSGARCQYVGVLATATFALWKQLGDDEARRIGHAQMAADGFSGVLESWLGRKRMVGGVQASNMCEMLLQLQGL
jgi:superfamily II DNA/RNA helicase